MSLLFPIIPFLSLPLFALAIILLTLGLRGRPSLSSPKCRKCNYDLRTLPFLTDSNLACPECGSTLSSPTAVSFGRYRRSTRLITLGTVLFLLPFIIIALAVYAARNSRVAALATGPLAVSSMNNPQLLAHLPSAINTPWDWQELERRHTHRALSKLEIDQSIASLITYLNARRLPGQSQQPLSWANAYVESVLAANDLSPARAAELFQTFYDLEPTLSFRSPLRAGSPLQIHLNAHGPWDLGRNQFVLAFNHATVDDDPTPLPLLGPAYSVRRTPSTRQFAPDQLSGTRYVSLDFTLPNSLPVGTHTLTFTSDLGVLPNDATFRGLDGRPGTPDKWPTPRARWQSTTRRSITIVPKDQPLIQLVTDPQQDPFRTCTIKVDQALVRPASTGQDLLLKFSTAGSSPIHQYYAITVQAGPQTLKFGNLVISPNQSTPGQSDQIRLKSPLPPDTRSIDITLTPDPQSAEFSPAITRIWAQPHTLKNIPLARYDLPEK